MSADASSVLPTGPASPAVASGQPIPVAVVGFSDFERQTLLISLQSAARQPRAYRHELDVDAAHFIVADGDQLAAVALLRDVGRLGDAVFVGAYAPEGAAAWLMRPMTPDGVLRELDELQRLRDNPSSVPLPLALPSARSSGLGLLSEPRPLAGVPAAGARRRGDGPGLLPTLPPPAHAARKPLVAPRVLLVDDSEVALHYLRHQLRPYHLQVDTARFAHQALELLAQRSYGVVFLDVDLGDGAGEDGLKLCWRVRHRFKHPQGRAPMLVMVSAFHSAVDQVRGTLAGADAYLGKPLDTAALDHLMRRLGFRAQRHPAADPMAAPSDLAPLRPDIPV